MSFKLCLWSSYVFLTILVGAYCQTIAPTNPSDNPCASQTISKRYVIINKPLIWHEAQEYCAAHNMTLATIESAAEQAEMKKIIAENLCLGAWLWIGANDPLKNGKFTWVSNNQPLSYTAWDVGQPNLPRIENCISIYVPLNNWHDNYCGIMAPFACEMYMHNSVPAKESQRKRYIVVSKPLIWHEAQEYCNAQNMSMATIESAAEHEMVKKVLDEAKCLTGLVWIGANAPNLDAKFIWSSNNQPLDFASWAVSHPILPRIANCVAVLVPLNQWYSQMCSLPIYFICEAYTVSNHCFDVRFSTD